MEQFRHINKDSDYVTSLQEEIGATADGDYGPNTHARVLEHYGCPVIFHMGKVVPLKDADYKVRHDFSLYELADGTQNWRKRKKDPKSICVHWGGLNSRHCYRVFNAATGRHVSSHFLIGYSPKDEELEVLQCLDTGLTAYHAGKFNEHSIGVDVCMHPHTKYWNKTKEWYNDAYIVDNMYERVPVDKFVMIGEDFTDLCRGFLQDLRYATGLDNKPVCEDDTVYTVSDASNYSIVGHHNISNKKWDVIPWAEKLYHGI